MIASRLNLFGCASGKKLNKLQGGIVKFFNWLGKAFLVIGYSIIPLIQLFILVGIIGLIIKYLFLN